MNFQLNQNLGTWLSQFNHQVVESIYKVDYNEGSREDDYHPWLFYLTFKNHDRVLRIEGDFDGDHIQLDVYELDELTKKLEENNFKGEPELWGVYPVDEEDKLGLLINKRIERIEYGIDKDEFTIKDETIKGQKNFFTFIRFYTKSGTITVSESMGLFATDDPNFRLNFIDTFDIYEA